MTSISIQDVGPVVEFEYELTDPGLHILLGDQGVGKTTILRTVELAVNGKVTIKPTKRDGSKKGEATVAGKTLKISRAVREEGELEVEGLGDLDISVIHSPKYSEAATRDKYRIKALVRLSGVPADISQFYELLGGRDEFDKIVDVAASETDDLVEMASKVKRSIEKTAQEYEKQYETAVANARAKMDLLEGVELDSPHDEEELGRELEQSIEANAAMRQKRESADETLRKAKDAQVKLDQANASYSGPTHDVAEQEVKVCDEISLRCANRVRELKEELVRAENEAKQAESILQSAIVTVGIASDHENAMKWWKDAVDSAAEVERPTDEQLASVRELVDSAKTAEVNGLRVREAIKAQASAKTYQAEAALHKKRAKSLRESARDTQDVLTDAIARIPSCPLSVWNDDSGNSRLVLQTDRSDREPFDELSDGERWTTIMPMCAGENRFVLLPQAAYGELSPSSRKMMHELARDNNFYILTGQASAGELRAEIYQESDVPVHSG